MALLLPSPFQMIFEARNETTKQTKQNPGNQSLISALFGPNDGVHLTFRVRAIPKMTSQTFVRIE